MTSNGKTRALLALAAACLAPTLALAQNSIIETDGFLFDEHKVVGFPMPKEWKFLDKRSQPVPDKHGGSAIALRFDADTPEFGDVIVDLWILNGSSPTNRLQALYERSGKMARGDAHEDKYTIDLKPVPHAYYRQASDPSMTHLLVHRRANGRAMTVAYSVPNEHFDKARQPLVELAAQVKCRLPLWPERAKGYDYVPESGIELAFPSDVDRKYRKVIRKLVKTTVKEFTKLHGKPYLTETEPMVIYVERSEVKKAGLLHLDEPTPSRWLMRGIRRMVIPVIADPESYEARQLVGDLTEYLLFTMYPESARWILMGEEALARMKNLCGKSLPYVPRSWTTNLRAVPHRLEIATSPKTSLTFADAGAIVTFFRIGPKDARKAYSELLQELRTTTEPQAAVDKLVKQFGGKEGQDQIRSVIGKKIKPVKDS